MYFERTVSLCWCVIVDTCFMLDYSSNYAQSYRLNRVCLQQPMKPYSHGYKSYSSFQFRKHSEMCTMNMKWLSIPLTGMILICIIASIKPVLGWVSQHTSTNSVFHSVSKDKTKAPPPPNWTQSPTHGRHFHTVSDSHRHSSSFIAKTYGVYIIIGIMGHILHNNTQRKVNNDEHRLLPHETVCTIVSNVAKVLWWPSWPKHVA
jgi:hypothetical protein